MHPQCEAENVLRGDLIPLPFTFHAIQLKAVCYVHAIQLKAVCYVCFFTFN